MAIRYNNPPNLSVASKPSVARPSVAAPVKPSIEKSALMDILKEALPPEAIREVHKDTVVKAKPLKRQVGNSLSTEAGRTESGVHKEAGRTESGVHKSDGVVRGEKKRKQSSPISFRFSDEVINHFRDGTPGWQGRIHQVLLEYVRGQADRR